MTPQQASRLFYEMDYLLNRAKSISSYRDGYSTNIPVSLIGQRFIQIGNDSDTHTDTYKAEETMEAEYP